MTNSQEKVKVAVITGGHGYDVINFHKLFRSIQDADIYIQHIDDFCQSPEQVRDSYDAVLFYIMMMNTPVDEGLPWYAGKPRTALEHLGETEQGIWVLHHAILAYPQWPVWDEIVGIQGRSFGFHVGQTIKVEIANPEHPITQGLKSWEMVDETYTMNDAGADSEILLTVDHPKSMKTIAWARNYKNARVFCDESGHSDEAWSDSNFRKVVSRGIQWVARRI
ncbi:ThuA domain-containing protein [Candidatus Poribacteria bacterium]|nr:ThuA domain-containing protein [Candidatus Poribacteria bacterium]